MKEELEVVSKTHWINHADWECRQASAVIPAELFSESSESVLGVSSATYGAGTKSMTHLQSEKANLSKYKGTSSPCCAVMGIMGIALTFESFVASSASNNLYLPLSGLPSSASRHDSLFNADLICVWFLAVACGERGDGRLSDCVPKGIEHGPELEIGGCSYCRYQSASQRAFAGTSWVPIWWRNWVELAVSCGTLIWRGQTTHGSLVSPRFFLPITRILKMTRGGLPGAGESWLLCCLRQPWFQVLGVSKWQTWGCVEPLFLSSLVDLIWFGGRDESLSAPLSSYPAVAAGGVLTEPQRRMGRVFIACLSRPMVLSEWFGEGKKENANRVV